MKLNLSGSSIDLSRPAVMGILNLTPDSFSDGGRFLARDSALRQAEQMVADGVDLIDVGGESTRPGAQAVDAEVEAARVIPVIELLSARFEVPISIDTSKASVMSAAVAAGASLINDVTALTTPDALSTAATLGVPVCLMHMQGSPRTMQTAPQYDDVVADIVKYLAGRVAACEAAGIARSRLLVDPGFGFGKTLDQNLALLAHLGAFAELGLPVLVGLSRKSMLGSLTGKDVEHRMPASIAAAVIAMGQGAAIVRVHDVAATVDALRVWHAVELARD
jgi:dihydropteroate synthase